MVWSDDSPASPTVVRTNSLPIEMVKSMKYTRMPNHRYLHLSLPIPILCRSLPSTQGIQKASKKAKTSYSMRIASATWLAIGFLGRNTSRSKNSLPKITVNPTRYDHFLGSFSVVSLCLSMLSIRTQLPNYFSYRRLATFPLLVYCFIAHFYVILVVCYRISRLYGELNSLLSSNIYTSYTCSGSGCR